MFVRLQDEEALAESFQAVEYGAPPAAPGAVESWDAPPVAAGAPVDGQVLAGTSVNNM